MLNKYLYAGIAVVIATLIATTTFYRNKYEKYRDLYTTSQVSNRSLSATLDLQNAKILSMQLENEKFKRDYNKLLKERLDKSEIHNPSQEVKNCNQLLDWIEKGY